jgi:hypothetical protein
MLPLGTVFNRLSCVCSFPILQRCSLCKNNKCTDILNMLHVSLVCCLFLRKRCGVHRSSNGLAPATHLSIVLKEGPGSEIMRTIKIIYFIVRAIDDCWGRKRLLEYDEKNKESHFSVRSQSYIAKPCMHGIYDFGVFNGYPVDITYYTDLEMQGWARLDTWVHVLYLLVSCALLSLHVSSCWGTEVLWWMRCEERNLLRAPLQCSIITSLVLIALIAALSVAYLWRHTSLCINIWKNRNDTNDHDT